MKINGFKRALVTGGLGFIGSHLAGKLYDMGLEVIVLDNYSSARSESNVSCHKIIKADIREIRQLEGVFNEVDLVFHVAANANVTLSINDPEYDFYTNTVGTFNIVKSAVNANVKRFVYVSSASVYGVPQCCPMPEGHEKSPIFPYGVSKLCGEYVTLTFNQTHNLPIVIGRIAAVYGTRENPSVGMVEIGRNMREHLNNRPIKVAGDINKKTRDFVHVSDVVNGLIILAEKGEIGQAYNIGSGNELSMKELFDAITSATDVKVNIENNTLMQEDTYRQVLDISKIKSLGYQPKMDLMNGLIELKEYLGKNPELPETPISYKKGIMF